MSRIHVHYEELNAAAAKFEAEAQELQTCLTVLQQCSEQLSAAWEGVAEVEFAAQLQSCTARMRRTPEALAKLSSDMKKAAGLLEAGERAAQAAIASIVSSDE